MKTIPAILPKSYSELLDKIERVRDLNELVQIDLVDGVVGGEKTWMPTTSKDLSDLCISEIQFDIMAQDWKNIGTIVAGSPHTSSIVFHVDSFSQEDVAFVAKLCLDTKKRLGLSVSNDTAKEFLFEALFTARETNRDTFVQVMGIGSIGLQSQPFDDTCLERIRKIRESFGDIFIQVDGAMRPETAQTVKDAGAEAVVVGSYLFGKETMTLSLEELSRV